MQRVVVKTRQPARTTVIACVRSCGRLFPPLGTGPSLDFRHEISPPDLATRQRLVIGIKRPDQCLRVQVIGKRRQVQMVDQRMIRKARQVLPVRNIVGKRRVGLARAPGQNRSGRKNNRCQMTPRKSPTIKLIKRDAENPAPSHILARQFQNNGPDKSMADPFGGSPAGYPANHDFPGVGPKANARCWRSAPRLTPLAAASSP